MQCPEPGTGLAHAASAPFRGLANGKPKIQHALERPATGRSSSSSRRNKGRPRSQSNRSGSDATMISFEEYDVLPRQIKKKYFSSTERLHIVQQSAVQKRRKHSVGNASWGSSSTNTDFEDPPATSRGFSIRKRPSQRQQRDSKSGFRDLDADNITEEQARWFLSLPDKIRKLQFSRTEQISLAIRCKRALQDTAPELANDALRRCLNIARDDEYVDKRAKRDSAATVDTDILLDDNVVEPEDKSKGTADSLAPEMKLYNLSSPHHAPEAKNEDEIVSVLSPPPLPQSTPSPKHSRSFSRASTLHSVNLPPPQLSPAPPIPPVPSSSQLPTFAPSTTPPRTGHSRPATGTHEPPTDVKYEQSDVRKQIRRHLSPQKFDEALAFGFAPPSPGLPPPNPVRQQSFSMQPPAFAAVEDLYADEDSSVSLDTMGPRTPTTASDSAYPALQHPSFDSSRDAPLRQSMFTTTKTSKNRSAAGSLGNREMTIHMTLTRRDLLDSPNENGARPQTSGVEVKRVDPLALEELLVCDDPTGSQGVFARRDSGSSKGLKKVWRNLRWR